MTPEQLAPPGCNEEAHQTALFCWVNTAMHTYPELRWMHAIPNGGSRGDTRQSRAITGGKMKAQGVKPGVSDLGFPVKRGPYAGLYIELKIPGRQTEKNGGASKDQIDFGEFVQVQGYYFTLAYGWEHARDIVLWYLSL